jgi:hypothetical protein
MPLRTKRERADTRGRGPIFLGIEGVGYGLVKRSAAYLQPTETNVTR